MITKENLLKTFILIFAEVEMLFFSGIAFGQNSLFPTLSDLNYYCISKPPANPCADQHKYLGYLLITTIISYSLIAVPIGIFYDRFGNYKTKIIGAAFVSIGCLAYALSPVLTQYLAYVAAILLGALAQTILTCNFALTSLYPRFQNIIVSVFTGSFDSSNFMMTFITLGYRNGISVLASFLILTFVGLFVCSVTAVMCYIIEKSSAKVTDSPEDGASTPAQLKIDEKIEKGSDSYIEMKVNERYPTLKSVLISRQYIMQITYLTIMFFRFAFFLAELNLQLNNLFNHDKVLVNSLLFNSSFIFVCAIVVSPFPGIVVDQVRKRLKKTLETCEEDKIYGNSLTCFTPSYFFCTSFGIVLSVLILIPDIKAIYCSFAAFMLMRIILFSTNSTYILLSFPKRFFGKLFGLGVLISGAMSFIQYGILFEDPVKLNIVNYILIAIVALTYIHPILLLVKK